MNYLLTEEAYNDLHGEFDEAYAELKDTLQDLCTRVADSELSKTGEPYGCIITGPTRGAPWYCDDCPVRDVCPHDDKRWSK